MKNIAFYICIFIPVILVGCAEQKHMLLRASYDGSYIGLDTQEKSHALGDGQTVKISPYILRTIDKEQFGDIKTFLLEKVAGQGDRIRLRSLHNKKYVNPLNINDIKFAAAVGDSIFSDEQAIRLIPVDAQRVKLSIGNSGKYYYSASANGAITVVDGNSVDDKAFFELLTVDGKYYDHGATVPSTTIYKNDDEILVPLPEGMGRKQATDILGYAFDENFNQIGQLQSTSFDSTLISYYDVSTSAVQNDMDLAIAANLFFKGSKANIKARDSYSNNYTQFSIFHVSEKTFLDHPIKNGELTESMKLLATEILFGWSISYLAEQQSFRSDKSVELALQNKFAILADLIKSFTPKVKTNSKEETKNDVKIDIANNIRTEKYKLNLKTVGLLSPIPNEESIYNLNDLVPQKPGAPIFIKYKVINPIETKRIRWNQFASGNKFKITSIGMKIGNYLQSQAGTGNWDLLDPNPDVYVVVSVDSNKLEYKTGVAERSRVPILRDKNALPFILNAGTSLKMTVYDNDKGQDDKNDKDDEVGTAEITYNDLYNAVTRAPSMYISKGVEVSARVTNLPKQLISIIVTIEPVQ